MIDLAVVDLSRLQFALTALYHFLIVPLTLGMSFMLVIMESIYVITRRPIWRTITRFWGVCFGINFALGVATGITMEFQFGMNWSYFSHYVGDIFGAPLAIEGLMAFFLEATFIGLMFFGWEKLKPSAHLFVTFMVALGTNLSAVWILVANGWMQNPVGAEFNPDSMRMEVVDFMAVVFNPVAQAKFVHTVSAGYVLASVFVLGISAFYLLKGKHVGFAKRSMTVASAFGLAASLSVVVLGDQSGYALTDNQKMKLAALEAMWRTEPAPAGLTLIGIPSMKDRETHYGVHIPWVMGLIATRTIDKPVEGIFELVATAEDRIESGVIAYDALEKVKANPADATARGVFELHRRDLGYGLLLKRHVADPRQASPELIKQAAWETVPNVPLLFWTFRLMAGIGMFLIAMFATAFVLCTMRKHETKWFLRLALFAMPLPWIAIESGWILAEMGRQPWAVEGVLPTFLGASSLSVPQLWATIIGFTALYGALAVVMVKVMLLAIKKGPFHEQEQFAAPAPDAPTQTPAGRPVAPAVA
jgi:cytochrome d ubiquinol oxidase subunit I